MTRGTALVSSVAEVENLTGQTKLGNLEDADDALDLDQLLITASDAVYDRLEADGIDPTALSNESVFRRTVAWGFLAILAALGHFSAGEGERSQEFFDRFTALADRYYTEVRPKLTDQDSASRSGGGIPCVGHIDESAMFTDGFYGDFPGVY